jgi:bleomycin hydrolase
MKKAWLILIYFVSLGLSFGQDNLVNSLKQNASDSAKKFKFTIKIDLEDSPVKNQGSSGTCWSYSGNSYLEVKCSEWASHL